MSESDPNNGDFQAGLRWLAEQLSRSAEQLEHIDLEMFERVTGVSAERAKEFLGGAGEWLGQADNLAAEAAARFGGLINFNVPGSGPAPSSGSGPHPLDVPTPAQGLALSAIDSGRWTVQPGSHVLTADGEGPAPENATGLVGELRARDWINAQGELTLVGTNALKRWMEPADPA
jgi:hypothetical protein